MKNTYALSFLVVTILVIVVGFSAVGSHNQSLSCLACSGSGVVDKAPCEAFTVEIRFKNTGKTKDVWTVNIAFESESWTWSGTPQNLTLNPCHRKTLTWNGSIPEDIPVDSIARLVVYYGGSFKALDWWIHVVDGAELEITSSIVE